MAADRRPLSGEELLFAVTEAMVVLHQRYYHRTPVSAKTQMLGDDLLACVLGGIYTDVEKTMIELERAPDVKDIRSAFQNAMQHKFINAVQRLSGRTVMAFISDSHVGPDIEIELFMLAPSGSPTEQAPDRRHVLAPDPNIVRAPLRFAPLTSARGGGDDQRQEHDSCCDDNHDDS
jgi:uncharacterized protein YbcI